MENCLNFLYLCFLICKVGANNSVLPLYCCEDPISQYEVYRTFIAHRKHTTAVLCMHAKALQSCPTLCEPMDCNLPGSSVHGILQARVLKWVATPSSRGSSRTSIEPTSLMSPAWGGYFFTSSATWEAHILL